MPTALSTLLMESRLIQCNSLLQIRSCSTSFNRKLECQYSSEDVPTRKGSGSNATHTPVTDRWVEDMFQRRPCIGYYILLHELCFPSFCGISPALVSISAAPYSTSILTTLCSHLAWCALCLLLARNPGSNLTSSCASSALCLLQLLLALLCSLPFLTLLDGRLTCCSSCLGSLRSSLFDNIQGCTDNSSL